MTCNSTDDFSPIYKGDTGAPFNPVFTHRDDTPVNLAGASLDITFVNNNSDVVIDGAGVWSITDASNGKASYAYDAADISTVGIYTVYITITIGGKPVHADTVQLDIKDIPS